MSRISDQEIIGVLKDMLSFNVTREDLARPKNEFVTRLYSVFLMEFGIENISQPDLMASAGIWNNEGMEKAFLTVNICKALKKCLPNLDNKLNLNIMDIFDPKRNRTQEIIGELVKLLVYIYKSKEIFEQIQERSSNIPQRKAIVDSKVMELKHLVEEKSMLLSSLKNKSVEQNKEIAALDGVLNKRNIQITEAEGEMKAIKDRINHLKGKNYETDVKICQVKEEIGKWKDLIIESPQEEIDQLNNLENECVILKNETSILKDKISAGIDKKKHYQNKLEECGQMLADVKEMMDLFIEILMEKSELNDGSKRGTEIEEEIKQTKIVITSCERSKHSVVQQMKKDKSQFDREFEALKNLVQGLKEAHAHRHQSLDLYNVKKAEFEALLEKLAQDAVRMDEMREVYLDRMDRAFSQYLDRQLEKTKLIDED